MTQTTMFPDLAGDCEPVHAPGAEINTRLEAAKQIAPLAAGMRARVLQFIRQRGEHGATDHEISRELRLAGDTVRPRRHELVQDGLVTDSGNVRPSPSGRPMHVWIATRED